jgi:hypothetical protein
MPPKTKKNEIWAADNYRGLYRISYNDAFETTKVLHRKVKKDTNDFGVKIFEFRNEPFFDSQNMVYL